MSDINLRIADDSDSRAISDFICLHFNGYEPIQLFHVRKDDVMDPPPKEMVRESLESGTTCLAYKNNELIGVAIAGEITSEAAEKDLEYSEDHGPKGIDVFKFISYIGEKADICNKLNVPCCLHIHLLSVHQGYQGQGVAKTLFKFCIENGRRKKFPAFSVDCTSFYTNKIAESFGMKCISEVTYDEYNEHLGEVLYVPTPPHTVIKTYAKSYNEN